MVKKRKKKIFIAIAVVAVIAIVIIAVTSSYYIRHSGNYKISKNQSDGSVNVEANLSDIGLGIGDDVEVKFSSGYVAAHVPIYTGDWCNAGDHVLILGNTLNFNLSHFKDFWDLANLEDTDTVHIQIVNKGRYINVENCMKQGYVNEFRQVPSTNRFYRGENPSVQIDYTIDMDHDKWGNNIDSLNLPVVDIKKKEINERIISALLKMPDTGNVHICSSEGTDYFIALIECLAGANYSEIVDDYMKAFPQATAEQYYDVKHYRIDEFLHKLTRTEPGYDMHQCDMKYCAERYLRSCGVSGNDIDLILKKLGA